MTETVVLTRLDGVLEIRLNRPEKKNALTRDMYDAMAAAFRQIDADPTLRCGLLTGTGDTFTSGNDIADFQARASSNGESSASQFLPTISSMKKPLVAAVNGAAIGVGTTMLMHCDLIVASRSARFVMPFTLNPAVGVERRARSITMHNRCEHLMPAQGATAGRVGAP